MIDKLLIQLTSYDKVLQHSAIKQIELQKEIITPSLIDVVEHYSASNKHQYHYKSFVSVFYVLALFKERSAYPVMVDFLLQKNGLAFLNSGSNIVSEGLGRILASVCGNDLSLLKQLIENESIDNELRDAGLRALIVLYNTGHLLRNELVTYLRILLKHNMEDEKNRLFVTSLLTYCLKIYPEEFYDLIIKCYEMNLINRDIINLDDIDTQMSVGKARVLELLNSNHHAQFINDVLYELKGCDFFK